MDRKLKGLIGQSKAISYFLENGYGVFTPFDGVSELDLIVVKNDKLYRVFIRSTSYSPRKRSWCVELRNVSRRKHNKLAIKDFDKNRYDLICVYIIPENRVVIVKTDTMKSKRMISIPKLGE